MQTQIKIAPEESLALEKVHYELNARKGLLSYIMTTMPEDNAFFWSNFNLSLHLNSPH